MTSADRPDPGGFTPRIDNGLDHTSAYDLHAPGQLLILRRHTRSEFAIIGLLWLGWLAQRKRERGGLA
jgi:hypothetical protein